MIPDAIDAGARLVFRARADRLEVEGGAVQRLRGTLLDAEGRDADGAERITVQAKRFVVSGGAINSPALLLRSGLDSGGLVGTRTFVHPAVGSLAFYDDPIRPVRGRPAERGEPPLRPPRRRGRASSSRPSPGTRGSRPRRCPASARRTRR